MRLIDADDLYRKVVGYNGGAVDKVVAQRLIEQQPTVQRNSTQSNDSNTLNALDTIYRQDAIDVVKGIDSGFVKYIEKLPSAQVTQNNRVNSNNALDTISRQAAIKEIHKAIFEFFDICDDEESPMTYKDRQLLELNKAITTQIKALPPAQPEPQWISCSERLPEANGRYLVTRGLNACGAMWNRVYIINYSDLMGLKPERIWWDGNVGKSDFQKIDDVIAWMPLPEPYKEENR